MDEIGHPDGGRFDHSVPDRPGRRMAGLDQAKHGGPIPGEAGLPGQAGQGRTRGEVLQRGRPPGRGRLPVDHRVADLGQRAPTVHQASAQDYPRPHPGGQREVHDIPVVPPRPEAGLAHRGQVGVVGQGHRHPEHRGQLLLAQGRRPAGGRLGACSKRPVA